MERPYTFAQRLTQLMDIRGLSKSEVARICDINKSNITRYCRGDYEAGQDVIYKMATRLNVSAAWLMGYDVSMSNVVEMNPEVFPDFIQLFAEGPDELDAQHQELIDLFDKLTAEQRTMIIAQLQGLVRLNNEV